MAKVLNPEKRLTVYLFTILGFTFLVVGVRLIQKMKHHHCEFYTKHRVELWLATLLLALPLTFRAIFDFLALLPFEDKWISTEGRTTTYNMVVFLLVDFLPIISQTASLIFGLMRHR